MVMISDLERLLLGNEEEVIEAGKLKDMGVQFSELMMMYTAAVKEIQTKLEILNDEFQIKSQRNPIRYLKHRIKRPESIIEKLHRRGFPISMDSIVENIHDIAGIRVVCGYRSDIYLISDMLMKQDDIHVLMVKDYIKNPKPNGYRSLHMVIEIPVFFTDQKRYMKVEVQIRTTAMDFWASLEHQLRYKTDGNVPEEISNQLRECAEIIHDTDRRMQSLHDKMRKL